MPARSSSADTHLRRWPGISIASPISGKIGQRLPARSKLIRPMASGAGSTGSIPPAQSSRFVLTIPLTTGSERAWRISRLRSLRPDKTDGAARVRAPRLIVRTRHCATDPTNHTPRSTLLWIMLHGLIRFSCLFISSTNSAHRTRVLTQTPTTTSSPRICGDTGRSTALGVRSGFIAVTVQNVMRRETHTAEARKTEYLLGVVRFGNPGDVKMRCSAHLGSSICRLRPIPGTRVRQSAGSR